MNGLSKKLIITVIAAIAIASLGLYFVISRSHHPSVAPAGQLTASIAPSLANLTIPTEFQYNDQTIPLTWTDDNSQENLIIQSDRKYYDGKDSSEVYFGITNISDKDQKPDIQFLFDEKESRGVKEISLLNSQNDVIASGQTNFYKAIIYYPQNSKGEFFIEAKGDQGGYGHLDPYYASGLVGMWSFNGSDTNWTSATTGTTNDLSGNGNTGTLTNMSRSSSPKPGVSGQALSFDGVDDYVDVGSDIIGTGADSVAVWIYILKIADGLYPIIDNANFWIALQTNYDRLIFGGSPWEQMISGHYSFTNYYGKWIFITASRDANGNAKIYFNGKLQNEGTTGTPVSGTKNITIGGPNNGTLGTGYWNGLIDDVRIYNRVLSASEIQDLYRIGAARMKVNSQESAPFGNSGLVGYWTFDGQDTNWTSATTGTTNDLSGNNNTGTMTNMSRSSSPKPGISGQALSFDGVDDRVNIGDPATLKIVGDLTISVWLKSPISLNGKSIISKYYLQEYDITIWSNTIIFYQGNGTNFNEIESNSTLDIGQWNYIVITRDTSNKKIYIYKNGVLDVAAGGVSYTYDPAVGTDSVIIGARPGISNYFSGFIDEVRVYNRALSPSEIQDLYRLGTARLTVNTPVTLAGPTSGLVGNWTFNGQDISGTTAYDRSGTTPANNGTIYGAKPAIGQVGQALSFDGVDDYVNLPDNSSLHVAYPTISAWVKINTSGSYMGIYNRTHDIYGPGIRLIYDGTYAFISFQNANGYFESYTSMASYIGKWIHLVGVYDGSYTYLYLNGQLADKDMASGDIDYSGTYFPTIGAVRSDGDPFWFFNGFIDEVRVYNRALSASEIQQLYQQGSRKTKL